LLQSFLFLEAKIASELGCSFLQQLYLLLLLYCCCSTFNKPKDDPMTHLNPPPQKKNKSYTNDAFFSKSRLKIIIIILIIIIIIIIIIISYYYHCLTCCVIISLSMKESGFLLFHMNFEGYLTVVYINCTICLLVKTCTAILICGINFFYSWDQSVQRLKNRCNLARTRKFFSLLCIPC